MKDELKDFVDRNRDQFDDQEPSSDVWKKIEKSVPMSGSGWWNSVNVWRGAAMVFMAVTIYLLIPKSTEVSPQQPVAVVSELKDIEKFYIKQIEQKVEQISHYQRNEGLNGFTQDFRQLEAMYMVLKDEMMDSPSEKVKDAMVLNLLVRIDLLNQQLHKLEVEHDQDTKASV